MEELCEDFIKAQEAKNTKYSTTTSYNFFKRKFLNSGEQREAEDIPPVELNRLVAVILKDAKKKDGTEYEPDALSTYYRGLIRHLKERKYPVNVIDAPEFELTRNVLAAKRKALVKSGYGNKPNATRPLSDTEEDLLWAEGYFSDKNSLLLTQRIVVVDFSSLWIPRKTRAKTIEMGRR